MKKVEETSLDLYHCEQLQILQMIYNALGSCDSYRIKEHYDQVIAILLKGKD